MEKTTLHIINNSNNKVNNQSILPMQQRELHLLLSGDPASVGLSCTRKDMTVDGKVTTLTAMLLQLYLFAALPAIYHHTQ